MAKPDQPLPSSSRLPLRLPLSSPAPSPRRRRPSRTLPRPSPSPAVLAVLAALAAAPSSVDGHPLDHNHPPPPPPDFLCPLLAPDPSPPSAPLSSHAPSPRRRIRRDVSLTQQVRRDGSRPFVPPRYEQGQDGRWRKSSSWSLYGSAFCACPPPQDTGIPIVDDQIQPSQTAATTLSPTVDADMSPSQLPPGWSPTTKDDHATTAVILILSLVLAVVICGFMICCIVWRKKRRARARELQDVEQKDKLAACDDSDDESHAIKRARSQQRILSKATAKWRAGIRHSARRRRAQRSSLLREGSLPSASSSTASLHTLSSSTSVSRRNALSVSNQTSVVMPPHAQALDDAAHASRPHSPVPVHVPPSPPPPLPPHPPAYRTDSGRTSLETLPDISDASAARPLVTTMTASSLGDPPEAHPSYLPSDAAHVATDDKVLLARMATLASAPPAETSTRSRQADPGTSSAAIYPSVPVLDEYEDVAMDTSSLGFPESGLEGSSPLRPDSPPAPSYSRGPSSFPLPPAKSRLAAPLFYEYPSSFEEDVVGTDPSSEPSAPPFEFAPAAPSAPPLDLVEPMYTVPSAPPESEETENGYGTGHTDTSELDSDEAPSRVSVVVVPTGGDEDPVPECDSALSSAGVASSSHPNSRALRRRPPDYLP